MSEEEWYPAQFNILPKGKYAVVFDKKLLGVFGSHAEAVDFQNNLGMRGSRIIPPNLREKMSDLDIMIAENIVNNWGKKY